MINTQVSEDWIREIDTPMGLKYTFCGALEYRYKHIAAHWNAETRKKYNRAYNDIILPALENQNEKTIDEYTKEDFEVTIERIRQKGYIQNGVHRQYAESTIHQFQNLIYYVVFQSSVYGLCTDVLWGTNFVIDNIGEEQEKESRVFLRKSLSVVQEKNLLKELLSDINEDGSMVALALMWGLGLRNAEACGLNYGDIKPLEGHSECQVAWIYKSTKIESNELQSGGKTYNTGRIVPVPDKLVAFLAERKSQIAKLVSEQGLLDVVIDELPICNDGYLDYDSDSFLTRCKSDHVTEAAHVAFENAGITSAQVAYLDAELLTDQTASILKEKEPTAYLLRRNFATQMCILELSNAEMQYLMGHCVEDAYESRNEFVDSERIYSMYLKLRNRTLLNNSTTTTNTMKLAIHGKSIVKINAVSAEPTDNVHVEIKAKDPDMVRTNWFEESHTRVYDRSINILETYHRDYQ